MRSAFCRCRSSTRSSTDAELRERQEFAFDVAKRLQRRFAHAEMWARMGVDPDAVYRTMDRVNPPAQQQFQQLLFSKIVPNCKKLGLLDAADGWLRERFTEIGVIQFEDWADTGEEYTDARRSREGSRDRIVLGAYRRQGVTIGKFGSGVSSTDSNVCNGAVSPAMSTPSTPAPRSIAPNCGFVSVMTSGAASPFGSRS